MIKLTFCLRRLPHLSLAEFQNYWLASHGPLVRKHQEALAIKRYVQNHADHGRLSEALRGLRNWLSGSILIGLGGSSWRWPSGPEGRGYSRYLR